MSKRSLLQELIRRLNHDTSVKLDDPGPGFTAWDDVDQNQYPMVDKFLNSEVPDYLEQESMDTTRLNTLLEEGTKTLNQVAKDKRLRLPIEFGDVQDVIDNGAAKHGRDSWLEPGVFLFDKRSQSELRHLMKKTGLWYDPDHDKAIKQLLDAMEGLKYNDMLGTDAESGLSHDLHSACNSLMFYTVKKRGILKPE